MSDSARSSRPSKRSLSAVDGDDSANQQQPAEKSVRKEAGPVPSPEVLGIHQNLAKLDGEKQAAIRIASEVQARIEHLEKLTEEKLALVDGEKKKLVEELQEKVRSLSKQLEEEKLQAKQNRKRYRAKIDSLKSNRDELTRVVAEADAKMEQQQEKIDELTGKLAEYEVELQQKQPAPQQPFEAVQQKPAEAEIDTSTDDSSLANVEGINTCPNLFDIVPTESEEGSVEFSTAIDSLGSYERNSMQSYEGSIEEFEARRKEVLKGEKLHCALCKRTFEKEEILSHFFSDQHKAEVAAECNLKCQPAYIDCSPFVFWMRKLESMAKPTIAVVTPIKVVKTDSIVYAAPGAIDGTSEDEDVEDEDLDEDYEDDEEDVSTDIEVE